ncbi:MAG: ankyrin repeat domain-containing protein [Caldilineaceae bacterium]|nr:ankyrin repeat domain-containing protein [Caldilineaceae bacterium]
MINCGQTKKQCFGRFPVFLIAVCLLLMACQPWVVAPPATPVLVATAPPTATTSPATPDPEKEQAMSKELSAAAARGDTATVLQLLAAGAALNRQDEAGRTPILAATQGNHVETVRALIDAGADIHRQDRRLDNPFLYAGAEGLLEILKLTIDAGANPKLTNRFGGTALIPAAERGHVEVVQTLLTDTDVDVNHVNNLGWTALLEAIILSDGGPAHVAIVQLLLEAGADVNLADGQGVTPLVHARQRGFTAIVDLLEAAGAK